LKLSILIPTLNEPESIAYLRRLTSILNPQIERYPGEVEVKIHDAGRTMPTGTKRNELIHNSEGDYFSQIDVDDIVPSYYVDKLMGAIVCVPDVVTFIGEMTTNGRNRTGFTIKLGEAYEERNGHYYRWPNHLCAFKRSVVEHIKFPPVWNQEDYLWSREIRNRGLLKSEVHINTHMYHYDFKTTKPSYAPRIRIR
jgi:glycosyltransferase involved in cell wall biosynthesis